jgi:two-component system chemotaxis response regulator CheY
MNLYLVDDDLIARMALVDVVESMTAGQGFKLTEFDSGQSAWLDLSTSPVAPDLVFCDVRMPGLSGLDLLQKMRELPATRHIPFVLISSASDAETIRRAVSLGANGYIVKPFSHDEVAPRLTKYFQMAKSKTMEEPSETIKRLKITRDRYLTYLGGLSAQIKQLIVEVRTSEVDRALGKVREKADPLISSCTTLGLWRASQLMGMAKNAPIEKVLDLLSEITQHLHQQTTVANDVQSWSVPVVARSAP